MNSLTKLLVPLAFLGFAGCKFEKDYKIDGSIVTTPASFNPWDIKETKPNKDIIEYYPSSVVVINNKKYTEEDYSIVVKQSQKRKKYLLHKVDSINNAQKYILEVIKNKKYKEEEASALNILK